MKKYRNRVAWLAAASIAAPMIGCGKQEGGQPGGPASVSNRGGEAAQTVAAEPGDPVKGARDLVARTKNVKGLLDLPEIFTNESAATMAVVLSMPIAMAIMMAQQSPTPDPEIKAVKEQMDALGTKYGMDNAGANPDGLPAEAKAKGRMLLADIAAIMDRLGKKMGSKAGGLQVGKSFGPAEVDYKVLGPTAVKLIPKKKGETVAEARFEDGKWRLHLGDFMEVMQKMQAQQGGRMGGPGMGGPPMGAPGMPGG